MNSGLPCFNSQCNLSTAPVPHTAAVPGSTSLPGLTGAVQCSGNQRRSDSCGSSPAYTSHDELLPQPTGAIRLGNAYAVKRLQDKSLRPLPQRRPAQALLAKANLKQVARTTASQVFSNLSAVEQSNWLLKAIENDDAATLRDLAGPALLSTMRTQYLYLLLRSAVEYASSACLTLLVGSPGPKALSGTATTGQEHKGLLVLCPPHTITEIMFLASQENNSAVVKRLLHLPNFSSRAMLCGSTLFTFNAYFNQYEIIELLLTCSDCNINAFDEFGDSALMVAIERAATPVVEQLLAQASININQVNGSGATPLMNAIMFGNVGAVRMLLARPDLQLDIRDNYGCSAEDIARSSRARWSIRAMFASSEPEPASQA